MRGVHLLATTLLAALALAGCLAAGPASLDPASGGAGDGLDLAVEANRSNATPGEAVGFAVEVENRGAEAVTYRDGCLESWNLTVLDEDGGEVAHGRSRASCDGFRLATLEPGESLRYPAAEDEGRFTWNATAWNGSAWGDAEAGTHAVRVLFGYEVDGQAAIVVGNATLEVEEPEDATGSTGEDGEVGDRGNSTDGDAEVTVQASSSRSEIAPGETVHVNLTAENTGDRTVEYRSGCGHTWEVAVVDEDGDEVQAWRPRPRCLGFSHEPLEPGETVPYPGPETRSPLAWNGTAWNGSAYEEVEPGNYTIEGSFPYRPDERSETRTAEDAVTVRVTD